VTGTLLLWHELSDEINFLPEKIRRIIKTALKRLEEDPFPGSQGNKEKLVLREGGVICRLHSSRRYTAFYAIHTEEKRVIVQEILPIGQAHKNTGSNVFCFLLISISEEQTIPEKSALPNHYLVHYRIIMLIKIYVF